MRREVWLFPSDISPFFQSCFKGIQISSQPPILLLSASAYCTHSLDATEQQMECLRQGCWNSRALRSAWGSDQEHYPPQAPCPVLQCLSHPCASRPWNAQANSLDMSSLESPFIRLRVEAGVESAWAPTAPHRTCWWGKMRRERQCPSCPCYNFCWDRTCVPSSCSVKSFVTNSLHSITWIGCLRRLGWTFLATVTWKRFLAAAHCNK